MRKSLLSLSILTLGGYALAAKPAAVVLEPIHVTKIAQAGDFTPGPGRGRATPATTLTISVQSNGCTDAKDFEVKVKQDGDTQIVSIIRINPDTCKRGRFVDTVELQTDAISLSMRTMTGKSNIEYQSNPIVIANPLPVEDNTTH